MLTRLPTTRLIPLAGAALALAAAPALFMLDDTSEPAARYTLTIDGESHAMTSGKELEVVIDGKKHMLAIEEQDTRVLQAAGVRFEYPRVMAFEYEDDPFSKIWTLDGNDTIVMVFQFPAAPSVEEFIDEQISAYSELGEVNSTATEIILEGKTVQGTRFTVDSDLFALLVEVFPIDGEDESTRWIILQDSSDELGEVSGEFVEVKKLLSETLERTR